MKQPLSLKYLTLTLTLLGLLLYGSIHFAAAQQEKSDLTLFSQIQSPVDAAALPPILFQPAQSFALVEQPSAQAVGIGDFNHDGRQDVAVAVGIYSPNYLCIFLQGEDGQLETPELYPADVRPEALAVGDLNGDGREDIAIASAFDNLVSVYLQTADGKLADRKQFFTQKLPDAIAVADINQDGREDVIVAHGNHPSVGVLQQQADGTLADIVLYAVPQAGNDDIDVGDVNGDGLSDIVKMNGQSYANPNLSVLHQTISGTMDSPVAYELAGNILSYSMAVGDVTGDGKADVVITHHALSVFAQQADGSLKITQSLFANTDLESIEIADVNGDGRNDVIATGEIRALINLQLADGTLASFQEYKVPNATHLHPQALDVGDINGDGLLDVVIANYNSGLVVLYHTVPATPTAIPTATVPHVNTATPNATPLATTTPMGGTPIPDSAFVFMPLISDVAPTPTPMPTPSPTATPSAGPVAFSATALCENEAATWESSPVTYPYGKRILATTFTFVNHIGQNWRLEWHYNGQSRPALDQSGLVTKSPDPITVEIFYGETGACQLPLPQGVYEVKIFLDNVLWKEGTATIQ